MQENFPIVLKSILESEGFYTANRGELCDPADSGGFTIGGITVANFCKAWGLPPVADVHNPPEDIKAQMRALTEEHMSHYYSQDKWADIRGDQLPPGVDLAVADVAVLHGPGKGRQFYRRALGLGDSMKRFSDAEIAASWAEGVDWDDLIEHIAASRRAHYDGIIRTKPDRVKWKKGWYARTARVTAQAMQLAPDRNFAVALTDVAKAWDATVEDHEEAA